MAVPKPLIMRGRQASTWYEEQQAGLGLVFLAAVDRTVEHVSRWPLSGALIDGVNTFPYYLAYIANQESVTVLAVAHERRRPRYWISRAD